MRHVGQKNSLYTVIILNFLEEPLTLHLQVKGHFLCVISVGDMDGIEAFLLCPHSHQSEDADIPEEEEIVTNSEKG